MGEPTAKKGRPSKYDPNMCKTVVELMREGRSKTAVAVALNISKETLYEFCDKHPDFLDAIKRGSTLSEAWWEEHGRSNLHNKDFNSTLWYMNMKNRHGWRDKIEDTGSQQLNDLVEQLKKLCDLSEKTKLKDY